MIGAKCRSRYVQGKKKGGPPNRNLLSSLGPRRKNPWVFFLWCTPPKHSKVPFFFLFLPPSRPSSFNVEADQKKKISSTSFTFLFFSSSFLWPLSIFFFYHHHHSSSSLSYPRRRTMQPRKKNIIITNENPDRLVLSLSLAMGE